MADTRKPVEPIPPRWKPSDDSSSISIPGLDRDASVTDQVEQIEQLITIKLQNIDENFAKIHNVLATRILPAVKRYSIGTEPVREAAKFWTSFYERAAQIRIPTYDEHLTVNEIPESEGGETENDDQDQTVQFNNREAIDSRAGYEPSIAHTDSSFMPGQDAMSSTPATNRQAIDSFASHGSNDPSWANSIQSPLLRLKSEIENLTSEDSIITNSEEEQSASTFLEETPAAERHHSTILPPSTAKAAPKAKGKEPELLRNVLKHNLYNASADEFSMKNVSPLKFKPKAPVFKQYNPYVSPGTNSSNWSGVVDLRDPNVISPRKGHPSSKASSSRRPRTPTKDESDDDSFDGLPKGMSPPVLMSPARPPRSSAELGLHRLGQSPSKQAVSRIVNDTLRDVQAGSSYKSRVQYSGGGFVESSMSTIDSPPSMSKYQGDETSQSYVDSTIDSMMRRVGLDVEPRSTLNSTPGFRARARHRDSLGRAPQHHPGDDSADDSFPAIDLNQGNQLFTPGYDYQGQGDIDSDSDSLDDEINNTAHPSAAFLMASQRHHDDDSFGSSNHSSDSLDDDVDVAALGVLPIHPFSGSTVEDDGMDSDDSFDYQGSEVQEETVFGVPPAQRLRAEALAAQRQQDLRMHGEGLLDDTIGVQIVAGNMGVDESPTPAGWGADELGR